MLAPHISSKYLKSVVGPYKIVNEELQNINIRKNADFNTKEEIRLHRIFGDEIRKKLKRAGIDNNFLKGKRVLEVCAGTGFLTYHLLSNFNLGHLTINDISNNEINSAKLLLNKLSNEFALLPNINKVPLSYRASTMVIKRLASL